MKDINLIYMIDDFIFKCQHLFDDCVFLEKLLLFNLEDRVLISYHKILFFKYTNELSVFIIHRFHILKRVCKCINLVYLLGKIN